MKRLLTLLLAVVMLAMIVSSCGTVPAAQKDTASTVAAAKTEASTADTKEPAKKLKFVWINPLQNYIGYVNQEKATKQAAADYGIDLTCLGVPTADGIIEKNAEQLENAVAMKPDAILCVPFNKAMYPAMQKAMAAGIPVIASGSDTTDKSLRAAYIGTDNKTMGIMAADTFNKEFNGKANVFIMMSQLDASNQVEAKEAFENKIKDYPGIKVIGFDKDNADMAQAMEKFDGAFRANKSIDTVWMVEGVGGAAAVKVAKEQNRTLKILEVDDGKEKLDNIRNGAVFGTLAQNFFKMGYESVRLGYEVVTGVKDVPKELDSGIIVVTKANVDTYEKDMDAAICKKGTPWKK
jgi:ribose transport system substrate-binding protein